MTVKSMDEVKLLGIKIDKQLTFNSHVSDLCQKTSRQVNALCRLRNVASKESKFMPYNYVTCKNVMSRRIVMVARGVMHDIRQSAPRGSPLIGAERRGFPPREESLVAWGAAAV